MMILRNNMPVYIPSKDNYAKFSNDDNSDGKIDSIIGEKSSQKMITDQQQRQKYYRDKILQLADFNEAFELAKNAVEVKFNMHRAGLALVLQGMPTNLGAYHVLGSNLIIMNRRILNIVKNYKTKEEYNSYLFNILIHEYLHSFGIVDEVEVRKMTYTIVSSLLGEDHFATKIARYQPWNVFPELNLVSSNTFEQNFEIIKNFDKTTQYYIG